MGSRLREKAKNLFEVFLEIAKPDGKDEVPIIIQQYPPDFDDKEALMMIPRFAYPCPADSSQVDHFTFVLTDLDSLFRFGYCRHATGHQTCLCIVSWLPWCEIFYKMLDFLAEIINRSENNQVNAFLHEAYTQEVPLPKMPVTVVVDQDMFSFTAPDPNALPRIPGSRNLTEYYNAVDPNNMMIIFASMLHERRIYMTSKKLSRLTSCIHAAEALLYPMHWQHLYIPVLPSSLIDYISAPMPYVIGVHSNLITKLKQNRVDVGDAVVVDLDANTVTTEYDDLGDLPEDVSSYLKRNLKTDIIKNSIMKTGDAISLAFLSALVRLIGGYRDALKFRAGEPITFDPESFVHSRPSQTTQAFLEGMLTLQIFQQFIYGRLEILNTGGGFKDIFEVQATQFADKLNSKSKYKEWLKSVKKSGKKGWNGLKVKAAPMMSTAVHSHFLEAGCFKVSLSNEMGVDVIPIVVSVMQMKPSIAQQPGGDLGPPSSARSGYGAESYSIPFRAIKKVETWAMTKKMEKSIDAFEMWVFRRLGRVSPKDKETSSEVLEQLKVKEQGKKAMADFKTKLSGLTDNEDKKWSAANVSGGVVHTKTTRPRPYTTHTYAKTLPRPPTHSHTINPAFEKSNRNKNFVRAKSIEDTHDDSHLRLSYHTMDMSLMTDTDIQAAMLRSASAEILSNQNEGSSIDSDSDSDSESDGADTGIAFGTLQSSDEGLNSVHPGEEGTAQTRQEGKSSVTGDKLIFTRLKSSVLPEPVAAPRKKRTSMDPASSQPGQQGNANDVKSEIPFKTVTVQDAPLIKFDSSESEPTDSDNFDPLFSVSLADSTDARDGIKNSGDGNDVDTDSRLPQTTSASDSGDGRMSRNDSLNEIFDPLSNLSGLSFSNTAHTSKTQTSGGTIQNFRSDPLASHSPRRDSADLLMHEWSLASLSKSHNISAPRATQPLKMRYPNNRFVLDSSQNQPMGNSSAFSTASPKGGASYNEGQIGIGRGQTLNQGLNLGHRAFDFPKVSQPGLRQPFRATGVPHPTPRQLSAASYAPYSRSHSATPPQVPGSMTFAPSPGAPLASGGSPHIQQPSSSTPARVSPIPSVTLPTSGTSSQQKLDFFSDLLDIDFGGNISKSTTQEPELQQTSSVQPPQPPQPKWETFD